MKTKILGGIFALAVMVATGYGVNRSMQKDTDLSEMAIKNIEALAAVVLRKKVRRLIVFIDVVHVRHYIKVPVMEIF